MAYVISLLQQNCTAVNKLLQLRPDSIAGEIDFCKLKNITPALLTGLLVLANYIGYTGPISYLTSSLNFRSSKFEQNYMRPYIFFSQKFLLVQYSNIFKRSRTCRQLFNNWHRIELYKYSFTRWK